MLRCKRSITGAFTLEGINEVKADDFPNIEVIDSAGVRILRYHIDQKISFVRVYHRRNENWTTSFQYKDDTATIYTNRIIYQDKCLEFSYIDTVSYRVFDVGILESDSMTFYNAEKPLFLKPVPENFEKVKQNSMYQTTYTYDTSGNFAKIIKRTAVRDNRDINYYIKCYPKNGRSLFWWIESQDFVKSLDCPAE
jgi:hypothetical protein